MQMVEIDFYKKEFQIYNRKLNKYVVNIIKTNITKIAELRKNKKPMVSYQSRLQGEIKLLLQGVRLINAFREWLIGTTLNYRITDEKLKQEVVIPWIQLFGNNQYITLRSDNALHILESELFKLQKDEQQNIHLENYKQFESYVTSKNWYSRFHIQLVQSYSGYSHQRFIKDSKDDYVSMYYSGKDKIQRYFILEKDNEIQFQKVRTFNLGNLKEWYEQEINILISEYGENHSLNLLNSLEHPVAFIVGENRQDNESGLLTGDYAKAESILEQSKRGNDKLFSIKHLQKQINFILDFLQKNHLSEDKKRNFVQKFLGESNKIASSNVIEEAIKKI